MLVMLSVLIALKAYSVEGGREVEVGARWDECVSIQSSHIKLEKERGGTLVGSGMDKTSSNRTLPPIREVGGWFQHAFPSVCACVCVCVCVEYGGDEFLTTPVHTGRRSLTEFTHSTPTHVHCNDSVLRCAWVTS